VAVFFGDVVPISLAHRNPSRYARWALHLLRLPYLLLLPVTKLLLLGRRLVRGRLDENQGSSDRLEAASALKAMFAGERLHSEERQELMRSVTGLPGTIVREVMVPRTDMVSISQQMSLEEILVVLLECGHSRIPVYGESLDEIVGLFYAKDVIPLMSSGRDFKISELLRTPYFVPETKPIDELLREFQKKQIHMAIVVDEFGGTAGLITLEDVIEEFFGDIQDEYDVEPAQLVELSEGLVVADARIDIDDIADYFDVVFPDTHDYDSLGGFLLAHTGSVPRPGDEIHWEHLLFRILEADAKRIDSVEIQALSPSKDGEAVAS
jgi:putative hemolysin